MENEEKFSSDPDEQLRIENELLKLKLQAELGAQFGEMDGDLPPEVEQQFLKQLMAFHEHQQNTPTVKLVEYLGNPATQPSSELSEDELFEAWSRLETLLNERNLEVIFDDAIEDKQRYDFVVNELFPLDIVPPGEFTGGNWVFDYEEFHPNDPKDMQRRVDELLHDFFANNIIEDAPHLSQPVISPNGQMLSHEALKRKVNAFHDIFKEIKDFEYHVDNTQSEKEEEPEEPIKGFVEGRLKYTIVAEDHTEQLIVGPFKIYLEKTYGWWQIFSFYIHGFSLD